MDQALNALISIFLVGISQKTGYRRTSESRLLNILNNLRLKVIYQKSNKKSKLKLFIRG